MAFFGHMAARGVATADLPYTSGLARGVAKPSFLATRGKASLSTMVWPTPFSSWLPALRN